MRCGPDIHLAFPNEGLGSDTNSIPGTGPSIGSSLLSPQGGGTEKAPGVDHALATSTPGLLALSTQVEEWWPLGTANPVLRVTGTSRPLILPYGRAYSQRGTHSRLTSSYLLCSGPFKKRRGKGPIGQGKPPRVNLDTSKARRRLEPFLAVGLSRTGRGSQGWPTCSLHSSLAAAPGTLVLRPPLHELSLPQVPHVLIGRQDPTFIRAWICPPDLLSVVH